MAVDKRELELLGMFPKIFIFLLRTYAANEVVAKALTDVMTIRRNLNVAEKS